MHMQGHPAISAAILAGGAATRLGGRDKGLEPLGGRPLVDWVLDALRAQVNELMIVANRNLDAYARRAHTIVDAVPGFSGPLAGVAAALAENRADWLLTVPVDCPCPPPDLVRRLASAPQAETGGAAWVAHDGIRRQPLFALYRSGLARSAARAAQAGQGPQRWQDAIGAIEVDFVDQRTHFTNLNEPGDFLAFANMEYRGFSDEARGC
jgi:molybdopterin-guanine dinucleotide biosynthesis protein A